MWAERVGQDVTIQNFRPRNPIPRRPIAEQAKNSTSREEGRQPSCFPIPFWK